MIAQLLKPKLLALWRTNLQHWIHNDTWKLRQTFHFKVTYDWVSSKVLSLWKLFLSISHDKPHILEIQNKDTGYFAWYEKKKKRRYAIGYKGFGDFLAAPRTHPHFLFTPLPLLRAYRKEASLEMSMTILFVWKWMFLFFKFQVQDQWTLQKEIDMTCKGPQTNMPEDVRSKKTWSAEIGQQKLQARYFLIEVHVERIRFPLVNNIWRAKL